ncbi:hypothetical protein [Pedobacter sp.]|jgi:hypothetical protein|uniref:hypothetical protein n=1 Tax=Pedobacter sp. TaxID=1411316 RepID=UPI002BD3CDF0|nr:hypothetical protein [Pedobacter sp.]HWW41292.1 hypothetical protein [Pedobacter sp.]
MIITLTQFNDSIITGQLPLELPLHLQALWYDGRGDWKKAHDLIDHLSDLVSAHVHAYLHRKEGDVWNADYWYRKAGRLRPDVTLEQEWGNLVGEYLPSF